MLTVIDMKLYYQNTQQVITKDDVVCIVSSNLFFHTMLGRVKEPTHYGAEVEVEAHSYPQRIKWVLRCVDTELVYIGTLAGKTIPDTKTMKQSVDNETIAGSHKPLPHTQDKPKYVAVVEHMGEACMKCGMFSLVRSGPCILCTACGDSLGSCG